MVKSSIGARQEGPGGVMRFSFGDTDGERDGKLAMDRRYPADRIANALSNHDGIGSFSAW